MGYGGLLALACTLALAGCENLLGATGPLIVVSVGMERPVANPLVLRAEIGARRVEVQAAGPGDDRASTEVRGARYGQVPVRVVLLTSSRDTLATVSFTQEFRRGERHWVSGFVAPRLYDGFCMGTVTAVPLRTGAADSLFVMHGAMPEDAVC